MNCLVRRFFFQVINSLRLRSSSSRVELFAFVLFRWVITLSIFPRQMWSFRFHHMRVQGVKKPSVWGVFLGLRLELHLQFNICAVSHVSVEQFVGINLHFQMSSSTTRNLYTLWRLEVIIDLFFIFTECTLCGIMHNFHLRLVNNWLHIVLYENTCIMHGSQGGELAWDSIVDWIYSSIYHLYSFYWSTG